MYIIAIRFSENRVIDARELEEQGGSIKFNQIWEKGYDYAKNSKELQARIKRASGKKLQIKKQFIQQALQKMLKT